MLFLFHTCSVVRQQNLSAAEDSQQLNMKQNLSQTGCEPVLHPSSRPEAGLQGQHGRATKTTKYTLLVWFSLLVVNPSPFAPPPPILWDVKLPFVKK